MANPFDQFDAPAAANPFDQFDTPKAAKPGMGTSALRGAVQGLTFGLADESYGLMQGIGGMISGEGFSKAYDRGVAEYRGRDKVAKEANPISSTAGEMAGGMGTGLGLAKQGVTLIKGGMSLGRAMMAGAAEGGLYGAAYGAGNAEGGLDERAKGAQQGLVTGIAVGGAVPLVARGIGAGVARARAPIEVSPERAAAAAVLEREGVPLSAGQRSGNKALQYAESFLGDSLFAGGKASKAMEAQGEAFTDAVMRRAGGAGRATSENVDANFKRIGQAFTDLSARNTLQADRTLATDLGNVLTRYDRLLEPQQKTIVGRLASDIVERIRAGNGTMPGEEYQAIRSWLSDSAQSEGNKHVSRAMKGLRDALDNNMMRSISPEDAAAWQTARREYGNLKDIAKASGGAGAETAGGLISPQALRQAAASGKNREAYARGQGDFAELSRAGNMLMTPLPNSGTAQRGMTLSQTGGVLAGSAGTVDPLVATIMTLGPSAFGRALWAGPVQKYIAGEAISPGARAAIENRLRAALQGGAGSQSPRLSAPSR